jgi:hypothetical protein
MVKPREEIELTKESKKRQWREKIRIGIGRMRGADPSAVAFWE